MTRWSGSSLPATRQLGPLIIFGTRTAASLDPRVLALLGVFLVANNDFAERFPDMDMSTSVLVMRTNAQAATNPKGFVERVVLLSIQSPRDTSHAAASCQAQDLVVVAGDTRSSLRHCMTTH